MTRQERLLAADLLDLASSHFSQRSCNDFDLSPFLTGPEALALDHAYCDWNGDPEEAAECEEDAMVGYDFALMAYFAHLLREEAHAQVV